MKTPQTSSIAPPTHKPQRFVFALLEGYSAMSLVHALECLQLANAMAKQQRFVWQVCTMDGQAVTDSMGMQIAVDGPLVESHRDDIVMVCSGPNVHRQSFEPLLMWLRRAARLGCDIGGLFTGAYVMAKAGLLKEENATIHWENRQAFLEEFPEVHLTEFTFANRGNRYSTAGGTAAIDLMLYLISECEGETLANLVADQLNYTNIRVLQHSARMQVADRIGFRHPKLSEIIALMETNLEEPLRPSDLAKTVNISTRQLERLFRRYLHSTPKKYYTDMRLARAQQLLLQTNMPVTEVGLACGFNTASHFSRLFRQRYGMSPHKLRGEPDRY